MSKVVVLKTNPRNVIEDYQKLMDVAEYKKFVPKNKETIIKLNLSWSLYYPACSTEPWQLDAVLKKFTNDGYKKLYVVENKTVVTDPWKGALLNKWLPIIEKYGLKFKPLTEVKWSVYEPKKEMLAIHKIFPDGLKIPDMFKGKNIVHLPTMKTHGHTKITGSMKNAFGGLITERRHHSHKMIHEVLVDLLQIQKEIHTGIFSIMDGTVCGSGSGPRTMKLHIKNYILASNDSVALDAVAAKMMGFDPINIDFIRIAHERGLGIGDIEQIDVIGEDISKIDFKFDVGKSPVIFKLCILGSSVYHDLIWYNLVGKKRIKEFMKTEWGKLFKKY